MGLWACLTCWNTIPETRPAETYCTYDNITEETGELGILVEKLLITGVPYNVFTCPERCSYDRAVYHAQVPEKFPFRTQPITSIFNTSRPPKKSPKDKDSRLKKEELRNEDRPINQTMSLPTPIDEEDFYFKSIMKSPTLSLISHRSELDEDSSKTPSHKLGPVGSTSSSTIPNPREVSEDACRDFIRKYGSIFTENIKDPIPKDPDPLNPSNLVKKKPLVIPTVSKLRDESDSEYKRSAARVTINYESSVDSDMTNAHEYSELDISTSGTVSDNSGTYVSEYDQATQTMESTSSTNVISKSARHRDVRSILISPISEEKLAAIDSTKGKFSSNTKSKTLKKEFIDPQIKESRVRKKSLRWKIIIRHRTPSTEPVGSMTEDTSRGTSRSAKDNVSVDSGYLQNDYINED